MDTYRPARCWRGLRAALVLATLGSLPTAVFAQATSPTPPEQLMGNLTDVITIKGAGTTTPSTRTMTLTLQNIQLKLDKPPSGGQARYVIEQMDTPKISGSWEIGTSTYTEFQLASPGSTPWKGKAVTIPWPSAGVVTCGMSSMEQWGLPYQVKVGDRWSPGPPFFLFNVPTDPRAGMGSVMVVGSEVQVKYTKQRNTEIYGIQNLLNPVPIVGAPPPGTPGRAYDVTETLTGLFGKEDLRAVDLEIPQLQALGLDKQAIGGLVVRHIQDPDGDNMAPRLQVRLCGTGGKVRLKDPGPKVEVYTQPTGGEPLTFQGDDEFDSDALPKDFYIEGVQASDDMRDTEVTAELEGPPGAKDSITLTVLSVDAPELRWHSDETISGDNDAEARWISNPLNGTNALGQRAYGYTYMTSTAGGGTRRIVGVDLGWPVEGGAVVHPKDFDYPALLPRSEFPATPIFSGDFFPVVLDRDVQFNAWLGNGSTPKDMAYKPISFSPSPDHPDFPPGNDGWWAGDVYSDVTPLPNGAIYNLDDPGSGYTDLMPYGWVDRTRFSFKIFADVKIEPGRVVRCSPITKYSIVQSWVQVARPSGLTWQQLTGANAPPGITVIDGDNNVYLGDSWFGKTETWNFVK